MSILNFQFLKQRAATFQAVRSFFIGRGYLEVDTPIRLPSIIPEANIEPLQSDGWYLHTSPELCMKRLLAAGHDRIFQICKCFRRGERGDRHLPEFTMLEWYRRGIDYRELMAECEEMLRHVAQTSDFADPVLRALLMQPDWQFLTVAEAFSRFGQLPLQQAIAEDRFDEVLVRSIEPRLGKERPTFLYDYPASLGSLARLKEGGEIAERFELYVDGIELANGFSELTDAVEQRQRFLHERALCEQQGRDPGPMPDKFLDALDNIGQAAGIAFGLDRLVVLLCGAQSIDAVVPFTPESL